MIVVRLFFAVPWVSLQFVIVVFPDHTHLLFIFKYTGELNEFNSFIDKLNFDKMPNMINFCVIFILATCMRKSIRMKDFCYFDSFRQSHIYSSNMHEKIH